jgi:type VI secretion system secreted protein VgrG
MALEQADRLLVLETPLGKDVLELTAFSGVEEISRPFSFHLEMISHNNAVQPAQIVGKPVSFGVKLADGTPRWFHGVVSRFYADDEDQKGLRNYRAEVVPWLWFLTRTSDCRIFQNKSAPEIIEQIFKDLGFSDFNAQLKGKHPQRTYCVQYRETDFDFVSRLMEEEGIFYFFKHEHGKHMLVLADEKGAYKDCKESEVEYPRDAGARAVTDRLTRWEHRYEFRSGKIAQTDYNFEDHPARDESTPAKLMMSSQSTTVKLDNVQKYELYDYPGVFEKKDHGQSYAKIRMEEEEAGYDVVDASSTCRTFTPGGKFKIKRHLSKSEEGKTYAIVSIQHSATEPGAYETGESAEDDYSNSFTCIPDSVTYRPPRVTSRPFIHGVQTAVVVGPAGEEIYPDKYGRVKVQFFWDREGKRNENSSCWIRVAQGIAGKNWGMIHIPRIGQEVVVSFLEGNPDRPLITGVVYNADQMPPFTLPAKQTQSGLKTNSSKGGGGSNEIRFDDDKGKEQIFIHAQYNQDTVIEHNETVTIGANRTEQVGGNEIIQIGGNRTETVGKDEKITIGGNRVVQVGGSDVLQVGKALKITAGDEIVLTAGDSSITMKKDGTILIKGQTLMIKTGGMIHAKAGGAMILKGGLIRLN